MIYHQNLKLSRVTVKIYGVTKGLYYKYMPLFHSKAPLFRGKQRQKQLFSSIRNVCNFLEQQISILK